MDEHSKCPYCYFNYTQYREQVYLSCCRKLICLDCYTFIAGYSQTICPLCNLNHDFNSPPMRISFQAVRPSIEKQLKYVNFAGLQEKLFTLNEIKDQVKETKKLLKEFEILKETNEKFSFSNPTNENDFTTLEKALECSRSLGIDEYMKIKPKIDILLNLKLPEFQNIFIERYSLLLKQRLNHKDRLLWTSKIRKFKISESPGPKVISLKLLSKTPVSITGIGFCTKYQQEMTGNEAKVIIKIGNTILFNEKVDLQMNNNKECVNDLIFDSPIELKPYISLRIEMTVVSGKYFTLDPFDIKRFRGHFFSLKSENENHLAYIIFKNDTPVLTIP